MKKTDIIAKMSKEMDISKAKTTEFVDKFIETISTALSQGDNVSITGFGTFKVQQVAEKTGIIQMGGRKGEQYTSPQHNKVSFKVAKALKDLVY